MLAEWLCVPTEWLRFGEGRDYSGEMREHGPEVDYSLMRAIAELSPLHQDAVRALVRALGNGGEKKA